MVLPAFGVRVSSVRAMHAGKFPAPRAQKNRPTSQGVSAIFYVRVSEPANEFGASGNGEQKPLQIRGTRRSRALTNQVTYVGSLPLHVSSRNSFIKVTLCNRMHMNMIRDRFRCLNVWPFRPSIYFYGEVAELLVYVTIRDGKVTSHSYFSGY